MDNTSAAIRTYFGKLGLEAELADIYLALHAHGPQTISELSRTSKVERTRIYRLIDRMMESNLIEVETHHKRGVIKAAPVSNLRILINQREEELKNLQDELGLIEQTLARNSLSNPDTRVQFYHGPQGIRQMMWNELNSKTEILCYANRILEEATGKAFMNRWTDGFEERRMTSRLLMNDDFITSWEAGKRSGIATDRKVEGMDYVIVPEDIFRIKHLSDVYDNVTTYYHWKDGDVFGIEIYNDEIADSQRQFFELLWQRVKDGGRF